MTAGLVFEENGHTYSLNGRPIPSVTAILRDVGMIEDRWFSESAAARGTYIHKLAEALFEDDLDEELVPPEFRGYLDSLKRGRDLLSIEKVFGVEMRVHNAVEWFAGTVDLAALDRSGDRLIVDWKSGGRSRWHRLQTWAYRTCAPLWPGEDVEDGIRRASLYLDPKGGVPDFSFHEEARGDSADWRAALRIYHLKREK